MTLETDSNAMSVSAMTRNVVGQMGQLILSTLPTQRTKTTKNGTWLVFTLYVIQLNSNLKMSPAFFLNKVTYFVVLVCPPLDFLLTKQMH